MLLALFIASCSPGAAKKGAKDGHISKPKHWVACMAMNTMALPLTDAPLLIRTDFSSEGIWNTICDEMQAPDPKAAFVSHVIFACDTAIGDDAEEYLLSDTASAYPHSFIFIVDKTTMTNPEHPILCLGLKHNRGLKLRTIPAMVYGIENNLFIANMDFEELLAVTDKDGIFRGFK